MKSSPAFQFYVRDFLVSTALLTPSDVGCLIRLLCYQWDMGSLPDSVEKITLLAGARPSDEVLDKFPVCDDGMLRNQRLESVRDTQISYRNSRAKNAKGHAKHMLSTDKSHAKHMPSIPKKKTED